MAGFLDVWQRKGDVKSIASSMVCALEGGTRKPKHTCFARSLSNVRNFCLILLDTRFLPFPHVFSFIMNFSLDHLIFVLASLKTDQKVPESLVNIGLW